MHSSVPGIDWIESSRGIVSYRLTSNGLHILLLPQPNVSVAAFMVTYHVGSRNEGPGTTGATHFLEHLMFKGTVTYNRKQGTSVFKTLQALGAQVNATTWFDRTNYFEVLPARHLDVAMEIEADRMRNALLSEEDLESERTVILNEFDRGENEPLRNLYHAVWSTAFFAHPYRHPTIGWRSDIEALTGSALRDFYDTYYWPGNATATVIGGFDREEVLRRIVDHFGAIPSAPRPVPVLSTREPLQRGERRVTIRQAGQLGALMLGYKMPAGTDPAADALDVLARILGSGRSSRLHRRLTDQGLTTGVGAYGSRLRDPGLFILYALLAPGVGFPAVEQALIEEIDRLASGGVSESELERARNKVTAQEAYGRDGPFAVAAQLNEALAAGDWKLYTTYLDRIRSVTGEHVRAAAETYLIERSRTVGQYIPNGIADSTVQA